MSFAIDKNNKVSFTNAKNLILFSKNKYSSQTSYDIIGNTSYTVGNNDLVLFISGSNVFTLTLPDATTNYGRNLFVVQRSNTNKISTSPNYIDVDQDANGSTTQADLLPGTIGNWAHLVSNGSKWVAISKNSALPTPP